MRTIMCLGVVAALTGCGAGEEGRHAVQHPAPADAAVQTEPPASEPALRAEAQGAVMALGETLKSQLQAAIQRDGVAGAVTFCHQVAPDITRAVSAEHGLEVSRVSLRNRNPSIGVPLDWQAEVLEGFDAARARGEDPAALSYSAIVGDEYRFMKAIPTGTVCLNCHGSNVAPEVSERLAVLYPGDKATGYAPGDIRGAFVVTRPLSRGIGQ